jgi:hypothetical protein
MATPRKPCLFQAVVAVGRRCFYCGARAEHADHIIANNLGKGGPDTAENLVPACATCNCTKGTKSLSPDLLAAAKQYAFIQAPLVNQVADSLYFTNNIQAFPGLSFST